MDEFRGNHIPAFGSWDCNNHLPFTECFESARQAGFIGYGYGYPQDRDLYVAGDLYENNVVTPAMIVVPRRRSRNMPVAERKKKSRVVCNYSYDFNYDYDFTTYAGKAPPVAEQRRKIVTVKPKAVDEDLYKISPELLRATPRRKSKKWGLFSMCMLPTCVM
ncbi:Pathogenic type III effector avirulence factor Avr cleavage site-containing protein [Artemisia annua]|uniref:Pathogenic type III effector avirulence factor Avr cleavage site-containing protein n=1 Tax=Artemisia annua TaxID=35608 RepID=A0A2U1LFA8_ARTAN|nr:Pathogenic type III effector avirulence factor Avr cleavage site-containing protein [Artemisia annua]